jgi:glycosyltransferase involved in cell wall biosynthesis
MNQQVVIQASEWLLVCGAVVGLISILTASLYDLRAIARRRYLRMIAAALRKPRQPHVTILIYGTDTSMTLEVCLRSIWQSRYRNYDIVVVDNSSTNRPGQTLQDYRRTYPKRSLYFYKKRKVHGRLTALQQGYGKSQKGDIVLVLDATATISPTLIREAATRFVIDDTLQVLRLNEHSRGVDGVASLATRLLYLSRNFFLKSATLLAVARSTVGRPNTFYKRAIFTQKHTITKAHCRYDGAIAVSVPLTYAVRLPLPALAFGLFFMTYFIYIAATLQSSSLLVLSWLVLDVWLLVTVWSDEVSGIREKMTVTFCLPSVYFLMYAWIVESFRRIGRTVTRLFLGIAGYYQGRLTEQRL